MGQTLKPKILMALKDGSGSLVAKGGRARRDLSSKSEPGAIHSLPD